MLLKIAQGLKQPLNHAILTAILCSSDLDLADCVEGKQYHDVAGGYQRSDIFDLRIDRHCRPLISIATPKSTLGDHERTASESATTSVPNNGGASFERYSVSRAAWMRSLIRGTLLNDESAANSKETRAGSPPRDYGVTRPFGPEANVARQQRASSKKQEASSKKQEAASNGSPGGPSERTPVKRRYRFQIDQKD